MEMGLLSDWDITKYQYLVEIRTSFLLNSFRKKDLLRKFLVSELKKILERLRFTFTPNCKRELAPRDQVFPLFFVQRLLLLHKNK